MKAVQHEEVLRERIVQLLDLAAVEHRPCRACNVVLWFIRDQMSGKKVPFQADGTNHWEACPGRDRFRRGGMRHLNDQNEVRQQAEACVGDGGNA